MQRFAIGSRKLRPLRAAAVTATTLIVASVALSGSPAYAINPPGIDPGAVPPDSTPGPSQPMKQNSYCTEVGVLPGSDFRIQPKYMDMLNLSEAWRFGRGAGVRVAVIDTGVTPHPRLPHLIPGGDYVMGGGDGLSDCDAHGTLVASMIAASPGSAGIPEAPGPRRPPPVPTREPPPVAPPPQTISVAPPPPQTITMVPAPPASPSEEGPAAGVRRSTSAASARQGRKQAPGSAATSARCGQPWSRQSSAARLPRRQARSGGLRGLPATGRAAAAGPTAATGAERRLQRHRARTST